MKTYALSYTIALCLLLASNAVSAELSSIVDELCDATPGKCSALKSWCESPESGSDKPSACVLINFVKSLSNQALCRQDPDPKECLKWQSGFDTGLQQAISQLYNDKHARSVIDSCSEEYALPASELGLNEEKQKLLERALQQFEQEITVPLRMYDSRLVLDCIQTRL